MIIAAVASVATAGAKGATAPGPSIVPGSNLNGQTVVFGQRQGNQLAQWALAGGGSESRYGEAFQRPDSLVIGMTGLSTTGEGYAVGNGTTVNQPAAITNSLFQNPWMWGAAAIVGIAFIWKGKK